MHEAWLGYAAFERARGNVKEARAVFKRSYARAVQFVASGEDAGEALCGAWLAFERECGSAEDYFQADTKARMGRSLTVFHVPAHHSSRVFCGLSSCEFA